MREPDNHTAWLDNCGYTWVRVDEHPGPFGAWHALTDDPGWDEAARRRPIICKWDNISDREWIGEASPDEAARAVQRVRKVMADR